MPARPRPTHAVALAAALIVALAAGGCGSSKSKDKSSSTPALTKSAFVAKANAICARGNKVGDAANQKLTATKSKAEFAAAVRSTIVPPIQAQITAISALRPPAADQAKVKTMLSLAQADLNKVKANPQLLGGKTDPFADFAKIAHPYGLTVCDSGN